MKYKILKLIEEMKKNIVDLLNKIDYCNELLEFSSCNRELWLDIKSECFGRVFVMNNIIDKLFDIIK